MAIARFGTWVLGGMEIILEGEYQSRFNQSMIAFRFLWLSSNLFGQYLNGKHDDELKSKSMFWNKWLGDSYSYKVMRMMVRPRCPCLYNS